MKRVAMTLGLLVVVGWTLFTMLRLRDASGEHSGSPFWLSVSTSLGVTIEGLVVVLPLIFALVIAYTLDRDRHHKP